MKLSTKQINEIAPEQEMGMRVYINRENLEFRSIPDFDFPGDTELLEEEVEEIESEWKDYTVIEKLSSREAYTIMEDFVDEVKDDKLQKDLWKILDRRGPFANFKMEIDASDYREDWFAFRTKKHEEYVRAQLSLGDIEFE